MNFLLQRQDQLQDKTFGILYDDNNRFICFVLEDEVREIPGNPVSEWKIPGKTAIPAGRYKITLEWSPKFGSDTISLHDVPGFDYIRMHSGNTTEDTEGCLLLGMKLNANGIAPGTSRPAVKLVKSIIKEAIEADQEIWIDVRNA